MEDASEERVRGGPMPLCCDRDVVDLVVGSAGSSASVRWCRALCSRSGDAMLRSRSMARPLPLFLLRLSFRSRASAFRFSATGGPENETCLRCPAVVVLWSPSVSPPLPLSVSPSTSVLRRLSRDTERGSDIRVEPDAEEAYSTCRLARGAPVPD
jgi:hypothetical protein